MSLFDCDSLLAKMKLRGMIPVAAGSWTDAKLLETMSEEAEDIHLPLLINARGEYLVKTQDIPFVAAQASYRPNSRIAAIRQVSLVRSDGYEYPLEELSPPQKTKIIVQPMRVGQPMFYTFENNVITLWPVPAAIGDSLRVRYHHQMSQMALAADSTIISAITPGAGSGGSTRLTVGSIPATLNTATTVDLVRAVPNFDLLSFDTAVAVALATSGTSVDIAAANIPADLAVGDRVCPVRTTPFPMMPKELHLCAGLRAAAAAIGSKGDRTGQAALLQEAAAKEASLLRGILAPRSKGNTLRLVNRRWR